MYVGTSQGAHDIVDTGSLGTSLSTTIRELPTDGRQLWVQLWYKLGNGWESFHYQFTAFASSSPPPSPTVQVKFQPRKASVPSGYLRDFGRAYTSSRGYGWAPEVGNVRDRNKDSDKRLDTFVFISRYNTATWRYDLPNGD